MQFLISLLIGTALSQTTHRDRIEIATETSFLLKDSIFIGITIDNGNGGALMINHPNSRLVIRSAFFKDNGITSSDVLWTSGCGGSLYFKGSYSSIIQCCGIGSYCPSVGQLYSATLSDNSSICEVNETTAFLCGNCPYANSNQQGTIDFTKGNQIVKCVNSTSNSVLTGTTAKTGAGYYFESVHTSDMSFGNIFNCSGNNILELHWGDIELHKIDHVNIYSNRYAIDIIRFAADWHMSDCIILQNVDTSEKKDATLFRANGASHFYEQGKMAHIYLERCALQAGNMYRGPTSATVEIRNPSDAKSTLQMPFLQTYECVAEMALPQIPTAVFTSEGPIKNSKSSVSMLGFISIMLAMLNE